jgi:hypothetical protein
VISVKDYLYVNRWRLLTSAQNFNRTLVYIFIYVKIFVYTYISIYVYLYIFIHRYIHIHMYMYNFINIGNNGREGMCSLTDVGLSSVLDTFQQLKHLTLHYTNVSLTAAGILISICFYVYAYIYMYIRTSIRKANGFLWLSLYMHMYN